MPVGSGQKVHVSWEKVATARRIAGGWEGVVRVGGGTCDEPTTAAKAESTDVRRIWFTQTRFRPEGPAAAQ